MPSLPLDPVTFQSFVTVRSSNVKNNLSFFIFYIASLLYMLNRKRCHRSKCAFIYENCKTKLKFILIPTLWLLIQYACQILRSDLQ